MKLALLNTSIITNDGLYSLQTIGLREAQHLALTCDLDSAVGHEATAQVMSELLDVDVAFNRQMFSQQSGQRALVFKLNGRPPEGVVLTRQEIEEIGYSWKLLTRTA
jgi:hypothetical protein